MFADVDALSGVLDHLRLRGEVFCTSIFTAPWAISFPSTESQFHVVERGTCFIQPRGVRRPTRLRAGDLVVLPRGDYVLADAPGRSPVPVEKLEGERPHARGGVLRYGRGGLETRLICGVFHMNTAGRDALLPMLPPMLHIAGNAGRPAEWLELTLRLLKSETARRAGPGGVLKVSRLIDMIFVEVVRVWLAARPKDGAGWLGALRDPQIGPVINAIHVDPVRGWSVPSLARVAAMSRSAFATRFARLVGEPPLKYLTRWRMHVAARFLAEEKLRVGEAAARVGYNSETAFSRTFRRYMGGSPLGFRSSSADDLEAGRAQQS